MTVIGKAHTVVHRRGVFRVQSSMRVGSRYAHLLNLLRRLLPSLAFLSACAYWYSTGRIRRRRQRTRSSVSTTSWLATGKRFGSVHVAKMKSSCSQPNAHKSRLLGSSRIAPSYTDCLVHATLLESKYMNFFFRNSPGPIRNKATLSAIRGRSHRPTGALTKDSIIRGENLVSTA